MQIKGARMAARWSGRHRRRRQLPTRQRHTTVTTRRCGHSRRTRPRISIAVVPPPGYVGSLAAKGNVSWQVPLGIFVGRGTCQPCHGCGQC